MKTLYTLPLVSTALLSLVLAALPPALIAQEKPEANPSGTWKWSFTPPGGDSIDLSVKLKWDGEKLAGLFVGRDGTETPIKDARFKGNDVEFTVVRERDGNQFVVKFAGKLSGDTIKGTSEREGQGSSREWIAKRSAGVAGTWKWSYTRGDGQTVESTLKLKADGDKLTGDVKWNTGGEGKIADGKLKGSEVSFSITRERDGQKFTTKYHGKLEGDGIKGQVEVNLNGEDRSFDWEAKRAKE